MLKNNDAKKLVEATGGSLISVDEARKKTIFTEAMRLQIGDSITFNVTDEKGNVLWAQDARGGVFCFATLTRGGRSIDTYRCYPSMLLREAPIVSSNSHSTDSTGDRAHNTGLPQFISGDSIPSWIEVLWGKSIVVEHIRLESVWALKYAKYDEAKKNNAVSSPVPDEFWEATDRRFYDFKVVEPQQQPQQPQQEEEAQPGSAHA